MVAPTTLPGRAFSGVNRVSDLLFHWNARSFSLDAITGQAGTFARSSVGGLVQGTGLEHDLDTDNQLRLVGPASDGVPRWEWVQDENSLWVPALRLEGARTNLALRSETMGTTWSATNVTVASDSAWAPNGKTTADTLTASAGNGTLIQDLGVLGSAAYTFSIWLKRLTGSGNIDLTLDNGATWTTKTITSEWAQYSITQTLANPDCGVRIVTSGDAVYAWGGQAEAGAFLSSYVPTAASTVTRAAESLRWTNNSAVQPITAYVKFKEQGSVVNNAALFHIGAGGIGADPRFQIQAQSGTRYKGTYDDGIAGAATTSPISGPSIGNVVEARFTLTAAGVAQLFLSINGGAELVGPAAAERSIPASGWGGTILTINQLGTSGSAIGFNSFIAAKIAPGVRTMDYMRQAF